MVLFYCTFVALKARSLSTIQIRPDEFQLHREKRLFQAYVRIPSPCEPDLDGANGRNRPAKSLTTGSDTRSSSTRTYKPGACDCTPQCGKASSGSVLFGRPSVSRHPLPWRPAPCGPAARASRSGTDAGCQSRVSRGPRPGSASARGIVSGSRTSSFMCSAGHIGRRTCGRTNRAHLKSSLTGPKVCAETRASTRVRVSLILTPTGHSCQQIP